MLEYIDEDLERFLIKQQPESLDGEQIKVWRDWETLGEPDIDRLQVIRLQRINQSMADEHIPRSGGLTALSSFYFHSHSRTSCSSSLEE